MKIGLGFVTLSIFLPTFLSDNADQSYYSGMQTRAQGGYVDPRWGKKSKNQSHGQKQGQEKEIKCETDTKKEQGKKVKKVETEKVKRKK